MRLEQLVIDFPPENEAKAAIREATMSKKTEKTDTLPSLCPLCGHEVKQSEYLASVLTDAKVLYLANLITHYRHNHITSWNKCWGYNGGYYRKAAKFGDYEAEKALVNERAKRQLIRKAWPVFRAMGITPAHFAQLQHTTQETLAVANKFLE